MCSGKSILVVFSICFASLSFAQSTVAVPSTAQNCTSDGHDANWRIVSSTIPEESGTGQAFCVTNPPGPWFIPGAGANWIAPGPDQANVSAGRKEGHEGEEAAGAHTLVDDREFVGKHAVRPRSPPPCLAKRDRVVRQPAAIVFPRCKVYRSFNFCALSNRLCSYYLSP